MKKILSSILTIGVSLYFIANPYVAFAAFPTQSATVVAASSQYFSQADVQFNVTTAFTIEAWIKPTTTTGFQAIVSNAAVSNTLGYIFGLSDSVTGKISLQMNADFKQSTNTIASGVWTHVAVAAGGGNVKLFINGVEDATFSDSSLPSSSSNALNIARNPSSAGAFYGGQVGMVRFWSTNLTAATIAANMCTTLGATTNLVAEWTLNNTVNDNSGNSHTLTNNNAATFSADVPAVCKASTFSLWQFGDF